MYFLITGYHEIFLQIVHSNHDLTSYNVPVASCHLPTVSYDMPVTTYQVAVTFYHEPVISCCARDFLSSYSHFPSRARDFLLLIRARDFLSSYSDFPSRARDFLLLLRARDYLSSRSYKKRQILFHEQPNVIYRWFGHPRLQHHVRVRVGCSC